MPSFRGQFLPIGAMVGSAERSHRDTMDVEIRKATEADLPAILRLYAQPGIDDDQVLALDAASAIFQRMATYPRYHVYVALREDAIVGTFALLVMDNLAHVGAPSAVVEDVIVDEAIRGRGVGGAMMKFAMKVTAECGCYKLTLSSNLRRTDAHAFYRSLGFEQHGISFLVNLRIPARRVPAAR
jgi:GNAT superfamily N-acetyltransferase